MASFGKELDLGRNDPLAILMTRGIDSNRAVPILSASLTRKRGECELPISFGGRRSIGANIAWKAELDFQG